MCACSMTSMWYKVFLWYTIIVMIFPLDIDQLYTSLCNVYSRFLSIWSYIFSYWVIRILYILGILGSLFLSFSFLNILDQQKPALLLKSISLITGSFVLVWRSLYICKFVLISSYRILQSLLIIRSAVRFILSCNVSYYFRIFNIDIQLFQYNISKGIALCVSVCVSMCTCHRWV